ncbi:gamma-glutamylcyclotransferase family protein [Motiliproteus sp. MSK22-1]|uniref:gamma-glutamylcyclotransferase family protein n=1 Tax=Motiliproteus sp. MSK22-1 TaxID=1897630 RepID=UPI000978387A|nr:gamma-glutamylcyclotransferase family protein [Motiliproteus sp. MSK22-1]
MAVNNIPLYLAYGSNLHPLRLSTRLPKSQLTATIQLNGCQLRFHKRGQDGTGKCNLIFPSSPTQPANNSEQKIKHLCFGALYQLGDNEIQQLDILEGGYERVILEIELDGQRRLAYSYQAKSENIDDALKPFDWYQALVVAGSDYLKFPAVYQQQLNQLRVLADEDMERANRQQALLQAILNYSQRQKLPELSEGTLLGWNLNV